jgi:hypothetical protein
VKRELVLCFGLYSNERVEEGRPNSHLLPGNSRQTLRE